MPRHNTSRPGVQIRILLHLRDYADYRDRVEVPFALSQMGIANAVSIARSNVPRAIGSLKESGHVIERQAHITGVTRKRKAYFLTDEGVSLSDEVWESVSGKLVKTIQSGGIIQELSISELVSKSDIDLRHVDVLRYMDDDATIDLTSLNSELIERDLTKHIERQFSSSLADLPRVRKFFGREAELDKIANLLEEASTSIVVPGIAGIGKTALATKVIERFTHRRNLLFHRCQERDGSRSFLEAAGEWLGLMGQMELSDYLEGAQTPNPSICSNIIIEGMRKNPSLVVIDDVHKISDEALVTILVSVSERIDECGEAGMVLFTRSFRRLLPEFDPRGRTVSTYLRLEGLDRSASRKLLSSMSTIDDPGFSHIYALSRGHPLVLELINRGNFTGSVHTTLEAFVEKEIFSKLTSEEKNILGAISVFREPIPSEALPRPTSQYAIESLIEGGLARRANQDELDVHDLVREFSSRSMDEQIRRDLHKSAAEWYGKQSVTTEDRIEHLYHLSMSGDLEALAHVLEGHGLDLVRGGHTELLGILRGIEGDALEAKTQALVHELSGEILLIQGNWDEAEKELDSATSITRRIKDSKSMSRILSTRADLEVKRGALDDALETLRQALSLQIKTKDARGAADSYISMGAIFRQRRDDRRAREVYQNVEEMLEVEDQRKLISAQLRLADGFLEIGESEKARKHAMSAHDLTLELDEQQLHARSRAILGRFYAKSKDVELSLLHYNAALETFSEDANPTNAVETEMLLGQVLVDVGRTSEASEHYLDALSIAEANDFRLLQAEILARLGAIGSDRSERVAYLQRSLSVFKDIGAHKRMKEIQNSVHRALMGR